MVNDGGPAFPISLDKDSLREPNAVMARGMSLRDYFAAKAMQGCLASCPAGIGWHDPEGLPLKEWAKTSYRMADAMLKAREES